jgi:hypothetical protein
MNIRQPLYGAAAARVRDQLAAENLQSRVATFTRTPAIVTTDGAREHTAEHHQDDAVLTLVDDETVDMAKLTALANDPARLTVSDAWDAIEAVFTASKDPELTRQALHEFVDLTAAKAVRR